jgi:hypothetical protein
MQKPDVDLQTLSEGGIVELRVRLDLGQEPFTAHEAVAVAEAEAETETEAELERTCEELVNARREVDELRTELAALKAGHGQGDALADAAFRKGFDEATVVAPPPRQMIILSAPPKATASMPFVALEPATGTFAARSALATPMTGRPRASLRALAPQTPIAKRITDTLSDLDVDFGTAHAIGRAVGGAVDRGLSFFGIWRASEWDDRDELRDTNSFAPITPWYRRSTVLLVLIGIAAMVFFSVGGLDWAKAKVGHAAPPRAAAPAAIERVAPAAAVEHSNLLAGTPLDPSLHGRSGRR